MAKKLTTFKSHQRGFTLIELMIVVAIVGILAAIATGTFIGYQAKAKQTEAKTTLGALGQVVAMYKAEFDTYATDWGTLGALTIAPTRYRYWYNGQASPGTPSVVDAGVSYADPGSAASVDAYVAGAVGNIDKDVSNDRWLYDQTRTLTMQQSDAITP